MPVWNNERRRYEPEPIERARRAGRSRDEREEDFRAALLNELSDMTAAIQSLDGLVDYGRR